MACLEDSAFGSQGRVQAERATGPGAHGFIRVCGKSVGVPRLRLDWSVKTKTVESW